MRYPLLTHTALLLSLMLLGCTDSASNSPTSDAGHGDEHGHEHEHGHEGEHGDHSEHAHPETLEDGLKELSELRDTVRDAFAADDVDTAHGPLHDVGHLLEDITGLVERQELTDEQRETAKKSIDSLFDLFGAVDRTLHGQDGSTYSEVSEKIDAAITALEGLTEPADAAPETTEPTEPEVGESAEE